MNLNKKNYEESFSKKVISLIKQIPYGKVATYGQIAIMAGNPRAARQVAWLLHSSTQKENLPWHRVVNSKRSISLPLGGGFEEQKLKLLEEGVEFDDKGKINFSKFLWKAI